MARSPICIARHVLNPVQNLVQNAVKEQCRICPEPCPERSEGAAKEQGRSTRSDPPFQALGGQQSAGGQPTTLDAQPTTLPIHQPTNPPTPAKIVPPKNPNSFPSQFAVVSASPPHPLPSFLQCPQYPQRFSGSPPTPAIIVSLKTRRGLDLLPIPIRSLPNSL